MEKQPVRAVPWLESSRIAGEMRCLAMNCRHYGIVIVPWLAVGCGTFGRDPATFVVNSESVALPVQWR
jgi:hypothetical protein